MAKWVKAKNASRKGGGKLEAVTEVGNKGVPKGLPKKTWSQKAPKGGPIDSMASKGNSPAKP